MLDWYRKWKNTRELMKVALIHAKKIATAQRCCDAIDDSVWDFLDMRKLDPISKEPIVDKAGQPVFMLDDPYNRHLMNKARVYWAVMRESLKKGQISDEKYIELSHHAGVYRNFMKEYSSHIAEWKMSGLGFSPIR